MGHFRCYGYNNCYYILAFSDNRSNYDSLIAKYIGISTDDYQDILKSFGAIPKGCFEYYFEKEKDCQKCCEYLNDKYGVLIQLMYY